MKILFMGTKQMAAIQILRLEDMLRTSQIEGVNLRKENNNPVLTEDNEYILDFNSQNPTSLILARGVAAHHGFIVTEE